MSVIWRINLVKRDQILEGDLKYTSLSATNLEGFNPAVN